MGVTPSLKLPGKLPGKATERGCIGGMPLPSAGLVVLLKVHYFALAAAVCPRISTARKRLFLDFLARHLRQ